MYRRSVRLGAVPADQDVLETALDAEVTECLGYEKALTESGAATAPRPFVYLGLTLPPRQLFSSTTAATGTRLKRGVADPLRYASRRKEVA